MTIDDDNWGYVDPEIISDHIPEITTELKFPGMEELKLNEKVSGAIDAENDAQYFIKLGSNKTIVLDLVATSDKVNVTINKKAVKFVRDEESATYHATYTMNVAAGQEYIIILTADTSVKYKLLAEVAQVAEEIEEATEEKVVEETAEEATEEKVVEETADETTEEAAEEEVKVEETVETTNEAEAEATEEEVAEEETKEEETVETNEVATEATEEVAEEETKEEETVETNEVETEATEEEVAEEETKEEETVETNEVETEATEEVAEEETKEEETVETNEVETEATEEVAEEETKEEETVETNEVETEATEEVAEEETKEEEIVEEPVEEKIEENTSEEEGIEDSDDESNTDVETTEEETVPAMVGWIVADAEAYTIGETATLTATSEADLNDYVTWQTKVQDGEWETTGFGNILKVDLTEENANNFYRFRMEDGNFSDEIQLTVAPAQIEETAEEVTEKETAEEEQTEVEEEVSEEQDESEEMPEEEIEEAEEEAVEEESLTDEEMIEMGYRKLEILNQYNADLFGMMADDAQVIGTAVFGSELWIRDADVEGWAEIYTEEGTLAYIKLADIKKQMPSDEEMLATGYIKVVVGVDIGANVYCVLDGGEEVNHLDLGTEMWVKLIDGADRAQIYNLDDGAPSEFVNLVDIIAILKAEGMGELPTRELKIVSSLDGLETVRAGTINHLEAQLINFREDDKYMVQWKCSEDRETFTDIEGAEDLNFAYMVTIQNASYLWSVSVVLVTPEEALLDEAVSEE